MTYSELEVTSSERKSLRGGRWEVVKFHGLINYFHHQLTFPSYYTTITYYFYTMVPSSPISTRSFPQSYIHLQGKGNQSHKRTHETSNLQAASSTSELSRCRGSSSLSACGHRAVLSDRDSWDAGHGRSWGSRFRGGGLDLSVRDLGDDWGGNSRGLDWCNRRNCSSLLSR